MRSSEVETSGSSSGTGDSETGQMEAVKVSEKELEERADVGAITGIVLLFLDNLRDSTAVPRVLELQH